MFMNFRQSTRIQNPQMLLLCEKVAHGDSARCEQVCMLLPQRSQGSTFKNHGPGKALMSMSHSSLFDVEPTTARHVKPHGAHTKHVQMDSKDKP